MTLVKTKPRRPSAEHRKRYGHHHHHSPHYLRTYWPYMPMLGIALAGLACNSWLVQLHRNVLGYATDMSIQELLDDTNSQRTSNGVATLAINSELDAAAQAKANDMAARDYWSHNTPDGKTPWTFITAAGYDYQTAGENLAYGFTTAADTITGWMNSPEHRANVLSTSYRDVGFGIINIADYQGTGPETLVVAMYGARASAAVAAATPAPPAVHHIASNPAPAHTPASTPIAQPQAPLATTQPAAAQPEDKNSAAPSTHPTEQHIDRLQLVAANAPVSSAALILVAIGIATFVILRHGLAWHKVLRRSETFVLKHPALDVAATSVVTLCVVLTHTAGLIQ